MAEQHQQQQNIRCLICNRMEPRRTLLGHISEHVGLKPHACGQCDFLTAFENEALDHESVSFGHSVQMNANPYISRIYRLIYNDCDYADRTGGMIEQVLHRPLASNYRANDRRGSEVAAAHSTAFLNTGSGSTVSDGDGQSFRQQQMESNEPTSTTNMISSTTPILPLVTGEHHSGINESRAKSISVDVEMDMDMDNHMELKPPLSITETGKSGTEAAVSAVVEAQDSKDSKDDDNLPDTNNGISHQTFTLMLNMNSTERRRPNVTPKPVSAVAVTPLTSRGKKSSQETEGTNKKRKMTYCSECQMDVSDTLCSKLYHITAKHLTDLEFFRCKVCDKIFKHAQLHSIAITHIRTHCVELTEAGGNPADLLENNYPACVASCRQLLPQLFGVQSESKRGRKKKIKRNNSDFERRTERRSAAVISDISRRFPQGQLK